MPSVLHPLLLIFARVTHHELARMVQYLKVENAVLRSKLPKVVQVTPRERARLVKYGKALGDKIKALIQIVTPRTFARWVNGETRPKVPAKKGRPRTAEYIRELVLKLAKETGWGYTRILGELKKLGIRSVGRTTVVAILREAGIDPGPTRGDGSWDEFLKSHAESLWACDFLTKKVWTASGLKDYFILFFINVATRRVFVSGMTTQPDSIWMSHQARGIAMYFQDQPVKPTYLIRDGDTKFTAEFCAVLESEGLEVKRVGPRAPNMNAHAERWVQTIKTECLEHFVVLGEAHLRHIVSEFLAYYHEERPHQAKGNRQLSGVALPDMSGVLRSADLVCNERLGGLLKSYSRKAA